MNELDDVDNAILAVLKDNSRLPTRKISKKSGVPLATVNRRMRKLIENGIIKRFTIELDDDKLGRKTIAYVLIRSHPGTDFAAMYKRLVNHPAVQDAAALTGQFDLILKVILKDNDELTDFLFNHVRVVPSVAQTETLTALNFGH